MIKDIIKKVNGELRSFFDDKDALCDIARISPYSYRYIKEFSLRDGKRIRPLLFILSYLGFAKKKAGNLYKSAVGLELIHAFILMHDDIVDRSSLRRGRPSLHAMIGSEKAMLIGDILYALGIKAFVSIDEEPERKEKALDLLLETAVFTGCGEVNELMFGRGKITDAAISDVYSIYDLKTSYYTFVVPFVTGAVLAGAGDAVLEHLKKCGISLGRAFQLKDDMLGLMADEKVTGKSAMTDLAEGKITAPLLYTYRNSGNAGKKNIRRILNKAKVTRKDLKAVRKLVLSAGTEKFIDQEIDKLTRSARKELTACGIKNKCGKALFELISLMV